LVCINFKILLPGGTDFVEVFEQNLTDLTPEARRRIEFQDLLDLEPLCVNPEFAFGIALAR
jgi:hypothetical protein